MNTKTHIVAFVIAVLVALPLILLIRNLNSSDRPDPAPSTGGYSIKVSGADWGYNCNGRTYYDGTTKTHYQVQRNNALEKVASLCDGQLTCQITASSDTIGFDSAPQCSKQILVSYRCFDYDRRRDVMGRSMDTITLDCTNPTAPPGAPSANK